MKYIVYIYSFLWVLNGLILIEKSLDDYLVKTFQMHCH